MEHPSDISAPQSADTPKPDKFPVGMVFLSFYVVYSLLGRLWGMRSPGLLFGPFVFGKAVATCYALISAVILSISLYAILRRKKWARPTLIGWYGFQMSYTLIEFLLAYAYKAQLVEIYQRLFPDQAGIDEFTIMLGKVMGVAFILVLNTIVCWYVYSMKSFFIR